MRMHSEFIPSWEYVDACPLCRYIEWVVFDHRQDHEIELTNVMCERCGLVYQNPRMTQDSLYRYYQEFYVSMHQGSRGISGKEVEVQNRRAKFIVERLARHCESFNLHLDIGSSTGVLLEKVRNRFGAQPIGVEMAQTYRRYSQNRDLEVYETLDQVPLREVKRFDLVTMIHVLEHVPEPKEMLVTLREKWLANNGLLVLEVPNLFFHDSFEIPHLVHFHTGTLAAMVEEAGYQVLSVSKHGSPRSQRFPLHLLTIAKPTPQLVAARVKWPSLRMIRWKRRVGRALYLSVAKILKAMRPGKPTELEILDMTQ